MKKIDCPNKVYKPIIQWCLDDVLQLESYEVNFRIQEVNTEPLGIANGIFIPETLVVVRDHMTWLNTLLSMFHELRHYYQWHENTFDTYEMWMTMTAFRYPQSMKDYEDYLQLPWEVDARDFATKTLGKWHKINASSSSLIS